MLDRIEEPRHLISALEGRAWSSPCPRATLDRGRDVARRLGYRIEGGPMVVRKDVVVEIHRLSKPDPETAVRSLRTSQLRRLCLAPGRARSHPEAAQSRPRPGRRR